MHQDPSQIAMDTKVEPRRWPLSRLRRETARPAQPVARHTTTQPRRLPSRPRRRIQRAAARVRSTNGGPRCLRRAPELGANTGERLIHRHAGRRISIVLGDATTQLGLLAFGRREDVRKRARFLGDAVPDITDELKALRNCQAAIVERWISHIYESCPRQTVPARGSVDV